MAAALALLKEGRPISLKAACERSGVDRKSLRHRHPETADAIRRMANLNRAPRRGIVDRRTGNLDAPDDSED
jgi:hypothetical protein